MKPMRIVGMVTKSQSFQGLLPDKHLIFRGFNVVEVAEVAASATIVFHHSHTNDAPFLKFEVSANSQLGEVWSTGIRCPNGLYVEILSGTVSITLFKD